MLKGVREVRLDWPVSNAFFKSMRDATIAANLTEPAQDMLLANFIQRQALTASEVPIDGRIRKIIGSVDESMDSSSCCKQQCALGRSARPLGRAICAQPPRRRAFPTKASPSQHEAARSRRGRYFQRRSFWCRWAASAQLRNSFLKSSDQPTAVLLPCTAFGGTLAKGVVTDFDLRRTILSAQMYSSG
jgi:hypothetical protein